MTTREKIQIQNKSDFIKVAHTLADIAGDIAKTMFRKNVAMDLKQGLSPVTMADLAIEKAMRDYLQQQLPTHGILGEEYAMQPATSSYVWVLDPIDGTVSFACGKPTFCTLIALLENEKPIIGLIDQPIISERWMGSVDEKTQLNGIVVGANALPETGLIKLACTTPAMFATAVEKNKFSNVAAKVSMISYGGDAYNYGLLAQGGIDLIVEADLKFYDVAALIPVIKGAGGFITDWQGQPLERKSFSGQVVAARNKTLHEQALLWLQEDELSMA